MSGSRILVVDDDDSILVLLERRLHADGFQVVQASTGREAFAKAKLFSPDLIILDIMIPELDGPETFRLLRTNEKTADIPVILLSGIIDGDAENPLTVTIDGVSLPAVAKPIDFGLLKDAIERNIPKEPEGRPG